MAVRIIGGSLKGRRLQVSTEAGLRPTPDRVRETLFNWLQQEITGVRCLDLFAGSGSLGLEAYSRGADFVLSIEKNPRAFAVLEAQVRSWELDARYKLKKADAFIWLKRWVGEPYDIIFLDPPFQLQVLEKVLGTIQDRALLNESGLLYIERAKEQMLPSNCEPWKEKSSGSLIFGLYKFTKVESII